jgi:hypothetical protein
MPPHLQSAPESASNADTPESDGQQRQTEAEAVPKEPEAITRSEQSDQTQREQKSLEITEPAVRVSHGYGLRTNRKLRRLD